MPRFTAIDLTGLTAPDVVEKLDFEAILVELKDDCVARMVSEEPMTDFDVQMLESEPIVKFLEVAAYRETILRSRINTACRAIMLAYSQQHDLEQLAAYYSVERMLVTPASEDGMTPAVWEDDERFRRRVQLAPEAFSTAGPSGAYIFHTMTLDPHIKDVGCYMSSPGTVEVLPLMDSGNGIPDNSVIEAVRIRLADSKIGPLTDVRNVRHPILTEYTVNVSLKLAEGPDPVVVSNAARASIERYAASRHFVGYTVYLSGITSAAKVDGVEDVTVLSPTSIIAPGDDGTAYCTDITIATT